MKKILYFTFITIFLSCSNSKNLSKIKSSNIDSITKIQDSLAYELCQIYGLDQGVRHTPLYENKTQQMQIVDSINFNKIIDFIKKNGYPSKRNIGENYTKHECVELSSTAVLLHNPRRIIENKTHFDLLVNEYKKGNLNERTLLNFLDKYYWLKKDSLGNRKLLYGSDFGKPCIKFKKESDEAREKIGLNPLPDSLFIKCN